jgi:hypothetical protein
VAALFKKEKSAREIVNLFSRMGFHFSNVEGFFAK